MKRRITLSLCALLVTVAIKAQNENNQSQSQDNTDHIQTLFNQNNPLGWWVGPEFSYTGIDKKYAFLAGISGGITVNHNFSIGLEGVGILPNNNLKFSGINDTADVYLYGGYGGLVLEYRIFPTQPVNIAFPLLIGGGGAAYSTFGPGDWYHSNNNNPDDYTYSWDGYFLIEPGVSVGFNLLKFMRLDGGISYRFVQGLSLPETKSSLMNGLNGKFSLKFGRF